MLNNNLIFDFDGVIADTSLNKYQIFLDFFSDYSSANEIINYQKKNTGISRYEILNKLYDLENIEQENEKKKILNKLNSKMDEFVKKIIVKSSIKRKIKKLSINYNLYLASNAPHEELKYIIKNNNLEEYFLSIYGSNKNFSKKDSIKLILDKFKIKKATYIGDTFNDYKIAKSLGLKFIGIKSIFLNKVSNIIIYNSILDINETQI